MSTLVADIEADGLLPEVTQVWQLTIAEEVDGEWQYASYNRDTLCVGLHRLRTAEHVVGHNFLGYDARVLAVCCGLHLQLHRIIDTLVLSRLGNPERPEGHALGDWGVRFGIPKPTHEDWSQWSPEMEERCLQDVRINVKVWETLRPMLKKMPVACDIEHKTAASIYEMCHTGIHFDQAAGLQLLDDLMTEVEEAKGPIEALLPFVYKPKGKPRVLKKAPNKSHWAHGQLDPGVEFQEVTRVKLRVSSRQDVAYWLQQKFGWRPTQRTKTGQPKINDEVLRGLPWPETQQLADYFKAWKTIGYLNGEPKNGRGGGWLHHVTPEGKLHAGFIPLTAVTGRPSCVAPNLQQVPSEARVRRLFKPRPGWVLVGVDADGQELRCLGHYLHPYDNGEYAREVIEGDIHTRVQNLIGFHTRKGTKPVEYGLIYGAGNEKLGLIALQDAMSVGETLKVPLAKRGKEIREAILSGITGFDQLMRAVRQRAQAGGKLRGLDGRTLWVRSPHSALNLLLQSAGIIHMKMAIATVDEALEKVGLERGVHYALTLWVHDELQFECAPEHAELLGKTAAQVIEDAAKRLGFRVPMSGTYQIGSNWSETH